jgi:hypothetical protein
MRRLGFFGLVVVSLGHGVDGPIQPPNRYHVKVSKRIEEGNGLTFGNSPSATFSLYSVDKLGFDPSR